MRLGLSRKLARSLLRPDVAGDSVFEREFGFASPKGVVDTCCVPLSEEKSEMLRPAGNERTADQISTTFLFSSSHRS
jgi:hypothetical protein